MYGCSGAVAMVTWWLTRTDSIQLWDPSDWRLGYFRYAYKSCTIKFNGGIGIGHGNETIPSDTVLMCQNECIMT